MEMLTNLDMVVAAKSATFALPEVKRGVVAMAGALPRIVRTIGRQRAMEMALTGRTVSASEAYSWGLVNAVTEDAPLDAPILSRPVVTKALEYAAMITENSPDSVIVSREGVKLGWEGLGAEDASRLLMETWGKRLNEGENIKEGGESNDRQSTTSLHIVADEEQCAPSPRRGNRDGFLASFDYFQAR
jgi:enoyl-CoA hydratase/carnithine racemase